MVSIFKWGLAGMVVVLAASSLILSPVNAQKSQSTNFQATGMEFDSFASGQGCSGEFCSQIALGTGLQVPDEPHSVDLGNLEQAKPQLDVAIQHGTTELGELSVDEPSLKTVELTVRGYLSGGYMLYIMGKPPRIGTHTINPIEQASQSKPGSEQFGINLVANNQPKVGSTVTSRLPDAAPKISPNYSQANKFSYQDGDMIASSQRDSSRDTYTISMIINVSSATPPGKYDGGFGIMAVPGF